MRRLPSSWSDTLLARLGFRRKRSRRAYQSRRSLFESLEVRAMLSGTQDGGIPLPRPEYVIVSEVRADDQPSDQFVLHTEYSASGTPQAVISLRDGLTAIDDTLHTLQLELQLGTYVLDRQEVLIDIESQAFRDQFLEDRFKRVSEEVADVAGTTIEDWIDRLDTSGAFTDLATLDPPQAAEVTRERLRSIAKAIATDPTAPIDGSKLPNLYRSLELETEALIAARDAGPTDEARAAADQTLQEIGQAALIFGRSARE